MIDKYVSSRAVDICATILSETPPQLPLRQEYMSLGFEVVYNAEGIGKKAIQLERQRAVDEYRINETIKELRKRRFFPYRYKRIREKVMERKQMEKQIAVPQGLSYESYQAELMNRHTTATTTNNNNKNDPDGESYASFGGSTTTSDNKVTGGKRTTTMTWAQRQQNNCKKKKKQRQMKMKSAMNHNSKGTTSIPPLSNNNNNVNYTFPDFLAPVTLHDNNNNTNNNYNKNDTSYNKIQQQNSMDDNGTAATSVESLFLSHGSGHHLEPMSAFSRAPNNNATTTSSSTTTTTKEEQEKQHYATIQYKINSINNHTITGTSDHNSHNNPFDTSSSSDDTRSDMNDALNPFSSSTAPFSKLRKIDKVSNHITTTTTTSSPMITTFSNKPGDDRTTGTSTTAAAPHRVMGSNESVTEQPTWIGQSKNFCNSMANDFCQFVVVNAHIVENTKSSHQTGGTNNQKTSDAFSVFTDLSPDLYDAAGMRIPKSCMNPAVDDDDDDGGDNETHDKNNNTYNVSCQQIEDQAYQFNYHYNACMTHPQSSQWIASVSDNVCSNAAIDICKAVVMDVHETKQQQQQQQQQYQRHNQHQQQDINIHPTRHNPYNVNTNLPYRQQNEQVKYEDDDSIIEEPHRIISAVMSPVSDTGGRKPDPPITIDDEDDDSRTDFIQQMNEKMLPKNQQQQHEEDERQQMISSTETSFPEGRKAADNSNKSGSTKIVDLLVDSSQEAQIKAKTNALRANENTLAELRKAPKIMDLRVATTPPKSPRANQVSPLEPHEQQYQLSPTRNNNNYIKSAQTFPASIMESPTSAWMLSAKSALQNITTEVCKVAGIETSEVQGNEKLPTRLNLRDNLLDVLSQDSTSVGTDQVTPAPTPLSPVQQQKSIIKASTDKDDNNITVLFNALSNKYPPMFEIERILTVHPEFVQVRQQNNGRMPIHTLCDRGMPDRSTINIAVLTDNLLRDIAGYKKLIKQVVTLYPDSCLVQDKAGDLPAHLIARGFMKWEAEWYEKVYLQASREHGATGKTALAITKLYHNMSESVEMLLRPIAKTPFLCRTPGSMGTILPLHIASIFTASVNTIRSILESYPEAASIPCDLGILQTFIPDESLPLELHDNLSTDFPKWEIEAKQSSHPEVRWSQSELEQSQDEDCMRRSDLLFAYNPIEPHRFEKTRLRRLEARIQFEAKRAVYDSSVKRMNSATELIWIWMCTFREPDTNIPTYLNSVKRIVSSLPLPALNYLVSIQTSDNKSILERANTESRKVIQRRLESLSTDGTSDENVGTALADDMTEMNSVESASDASDTTEKTIEMASEFRLHVGHGFVTNLCRLVFNVKETSCPSSFVVLPYKLALRDGKLRMASQDSLVVAAKFAESLLNLTDPRSVLYYLDIKATDFYDHAIFHPSMDGTTRLDTYTRVKGFEESLMSLYESGNAYLYLLDEATGLPKVANGESVYPITLKEPLYAVRKLLPLMMMGMVQMRGEKAISKVASVILDKNVSSLTPSWVMAAEKLRTFLEGKENDEKELSSELFGLKQGLRKFLSKSKKLIQRQPKGELDSEWAEELSYLKELLSQNDPTCEYLKYKTLNENIDNGKVNLKTSSINKKKNVIEDPDSVASLQKKLDALSELHLHVGGGKVKQVPATSSENGDNDTKRQKSVNSRYSVLYNESEHRAPADDESNDKIENNLSSGGIKLWNAAKNIWEDVTHELENNVQTSDDPMITNLKVALAEQAKKLAFLGKKVASLKEAENSAFPSVSEEDISNILEEASIAASRNDLAEARKLVLRMCELEERLLHDEIAIQHLTMETNIMNDEKDEMMQQHFSPKESSLRPDLWVESRYADDEDSVSLSASVHPSQDYLHTGRVVQHQPWIENAQTTHLQGNSEDPLDREIVDLADRSDVSDAPFSMISFDNRIRTETLAPIGEQSNYTPGPYMANSAKGNMWSTVGDVPSKGANNARIIWDKKVNPFSSMSPEPYDVVDADIVSTRFTVERRTYSFSSSKASNEVVDVTDISDVSSFFSNPRRNIASTKPLEIVDVTEMSSSQPYSTSMAQSGYAMTHASTEIVDICELSSGYINELNRRHLVYPVYEFSEEELPEVVQISDHRDTSPSRRFPPPLTTVRPNIPNEYAAANNRFRPPSQSSGEYTPVPTIVIGSSGRRYGSESSYGGDVMSSSTTVVDNRINRIDYVSASRHSETVNYNQYNRSLLSPRTVEIEKVIAKYTRPPPIENYSYGSYRKETRKSSYNQY